MRVAGADVWRGRWVVVVLEDGRFHSAFIVPSILEALARCPEVAALGVDMPIGLPEPGGAREAEPLARAYVARAGRRCSLRPRR